MKIFFISMLLFIPTLGTSSEFTSQTICKKKPDSRNDIRLAGGAIVFGTLYYCGHYLLQSYSTHTDSNNDQKTIVTPTENLIVPDPFKFSKIVLESMPQTSDELKNNLKSIYLYILKNNKLIETYPTYNKPTEKLAAILIEFKAWLETITRVNIELESVFKVQNSNRKIKLNQIVISSYGLKEYQKIYPYLENIVPEKFWLINKNYYKNHIWEQVNKNVNKFINDQKYLQSNSQRCIAKNIADYEFVVYQLCGISYRHTKKIIEYQNDLANFLSRSMTESQAQSVLDRIKIEIHNISNANYLTKTQLELIKKHLN